MNKSPHSKKHSVKRSRTPTPTTLSSTANSNSNSNRNSNSNSNSNTKDKQRNSILNRFRLRSSSNTNTNTNEGNSSNSNEHAIDHDDKIRNRSSPSSSPSKLSSPLSLPSSSSSRTSSSISPQKSPNNNKSKASSSSSSSPSSSAKKGKGLKRFMKRGKSSSKKQYEVLDNFESGGIQNKQLQQQQHQQHHAQQQSTIPSLGKENIKNNKNLNNSNNNNASNDNNNNNDNSNMNYYLNYTNNDNNKNNNNNSHDNATIIQKKKRKSLDTLEKNNTHGTAAISTSTSIATTASVRSNGNSNSDRYRGCDKDDTYKYNHNHNRNSNSNNYQSSYDDDDDNNNDNNDYGNTSDNTIVNIDLNNMDDEYSYNQQGDGSSSSSNLKRFRNMDYTRDNNKTTTAPFETIEINALSNADHTNTIIEEDDDDDEEEMVDDDSLLSPSFVPNNSTNVDDSFYFDNEEDNEEDTDNDNDNDDDDDDDNSCASTVVNDKPPRVVRPPPTATKAEQAKFYWELCYGKETKKMDVVAPTIKSWSVNRKPPVKSCLSAKKTPWTEIAQSTKKRSVRRNNIHLNSSNKQQKSTPTVCDHFHFQQDDGKNIHHPSPMEQREGTNSSSCTSTGKEHDTPMVKTPQNNDSSGIKSVKFGDASAAEFESSRPTVELTPLPSDKVRERFPVEEKDIQSDDESVELHHETARNGARLALWDDDFDDYIDEEWGENDVDMGNNYDSDNDDSAKFSRQSRGSGRNDSSRRSDRRSSVFFSRGGGSLVKFDVSKEKKSHPSDSPVERNRNMRQSDDNDSKVSIGDNNKFSPISRESMQFSSPSTIASYRLSTSDSDTSKVTPKADLNSSSSLLRSVHSAGGASMGRNLDDMTQELKPSQLDLTLRKAERSNCPRESKRASQPDKSLINKIVKEIEMLTFETDTILDDNFGTLLKERSRYFGSSYDIAVSALLNNLLSNMNIHSHVEISDAICQIVQSNSPVEANVGQHDVAEVLNMSVAFIERELLTMKECDAEETKTLAGLVHQTFDSDERTDLYSALVETAFSHWDQLESQALQTVSSCFQLVNQANCEEEIAIMELMEKSTHRENDEKYQRRKKAKKDSHSEIIKEMKAIEDLENRIYKEEQELKHLYQMSSLCSLKVDVEMYSPLVAIDYILLKMILTFNEKLLMIDKVDISYPHLDGHSSETQISWSSSCHNLKEARQSICSLDSALSFDGMYDLLSRTPIIKRIKKTENTNYISNDEYLPKRSAAYKLYTGMLDGDHMSRFVSYCFKQEQETGILTVTDIFQRLNLMAMDVMELHKYYKCRVERPSKSSCIILHVTISLGVALSIAIRFTYDLSSQRTILYSIPSDVFISPITGEPPVPINILLRVAQYTISSEPISNAFLLKRTCSAVVDTLQGRDL